MSSSLFNSYLAVSKDMADYYAGLTTGAGTATTMVDAALMGKQNDWITDNTFVILSDEPTGSAAIYDERKVSSLDNTTGTLTTLTFAAAPGTGIDYYLNRLFSPSDIRTALVQAAKLVHPSLFTRVWDESHRAGNWLKDGSMDVWTSTSALTYWTKSALTETQTSTARLFMNGSYSCKLSTAAGYIGQSIADNDDLKYLRGKHVTFTGRGWCDTASCLRLAIYDGTTTTYSSYHAGNSAWDNVTDPWSVDADISETATEVAFRVYFDVLTANAYVDDLRVMGTFYPKINIHDLNLAQDRPIRISYFPNEDNLLSPIPIRNYVLDTDYIYLDEAYAGNRLRIEGIGYLDYLASGVSSTDWTATIAIDEPQLKILSAQAVVWLYQQMSMPNYSSDIRNSFAETKTFWEQELAKRKAVFGMRPPVARTHWSV
jgi:hypothetical protein